MASLVLDDENINAIASEIADRAFEKFNERLEAWEKWPPVLNRKQAMEFLDIKENKLNELSKRPDFPVNRELGFPKFPTRLLHQWVEKTTLNGTIPLEEVI